MPNTEKGFAPIVLFLLVAIVVVIGFIVYQFKDQLNFKDGLPVPPSASSSPIQTAQAKVSVQFDQGVAPNTLKKGDLISVHVIVSAAEDINLVSSKISYPKDRLIFKRFVEPGGSADSVMWMSQKNIPAEGRIELTGGIPDPGLKLSDGSSVVISKLEFEVRSELGNGLIISPTEAKLYSNGTNEELPGVVLEGSDAAKEVLGTESGNIIKLHPAEVSTAPGCNFVVIAKYESVGHTRGVDFILNSSDPAKVKAVSYVDDKELSAKHSIITQLNKTSGVINSSVLEPINRTSLPNSATITAITYKVAENAGDGTVKLEFKFDPENPQNTTDSNIVSSEIKDMIDKVSGATVKIAKGNKCEQPASTTEVTSTTVTIKPIQTGTPTISAVQITDSEGDLSADGEITLSDMSVLLSKFNKPRKSAVDRLAGDLNKDGKVNVHDYSIMTRFLIKKQVISE